MSPHKDLLLFNLGFSTHHWDKPSEVTSLGGSLIVGLGGLNNDTRVLRVIMFFPIPTRLGSGDLRLHSGDISLARVFRLGFGLNLEEGRIRILQESARQRGQYCS